MPKELKIHDKVLNAVLDNNIENLGTDDDNDERGVSEKDPDSDAEESQSLLKGLKRRLSSERGCAPAQKNFNNNEENSTTLNNNIQELNVPSGENTSQSTPQKKIKGNESSPPDSAQFNRAPGVTSPIISKSRKRSLCKVNHEWFTRIDSNGDTVKSYLRPIRGDQYTLECAADGTRFSCKTRGYSALQASFYLTSFPYSTGNLK